MPVLTTALPGPLPLCSPNGYYRTGDASPTNNVCYRIPGGYYASEFASSQPADTGAYEITACPQGSYANWGSSAADLTWAPTNDATQLTPTGTRVPASASVCKVCDADSYAQLTAATTCATCPVSWLWLRFAAGSCFRRCCAAHACPCRPAEPTPAPSRPDLSSLPTLLQAGTEPVAAASADHIVKSDGTTAAATGTAGATDVPNKACQACAAGYYRKDKADGGSSNVCEACTAGSATKVPTGATECEACPAGTYSAALATACTPW